MKEEWETSSASGISLRAFCHYHAKALGLFCDSDSLKTIVEAEDMVKDHPELVRRLASASVVVEAMVKDKLTRVARALFHKDIARRLDDLEHCDFEDDAVADFEANMKLQCAQLHQKNGMTCTLPFLMAPKLTITTDALDDDHVVRFEARVTCCRAPIATLGRILSRNALHRSDHP